MLCIPSLIADVKVSEGYGQTQTVALFNIRVVETDAPEDTGEVLSSPRGLQTTRLKHGVMRWIVYRWALSANEDSS